MYNERSDLQKQNEFWDTYREQTWSRDMLEALGRGHDGKGGESATDPATAETKPQNTLMVLENYGLKI